MTTTLDRAMKLWMTLNPPEQIQRTNGEKITAIEAALQAEATALQERVTALQSERDALRAQLDAQWQSIDTAPKDGRAILLYPCGIFGADQAGIGYWDRDKDYEAWRTLDGERIEELTHWRALPEPPVSQQV